jgi:hypothetical protein
MMVQEGSPRRWRDLVFPGANPGTCADTIGTWTKPLLHMPYRHSEKWIRDAGQGRRLVQRGRGDG